MSVLSNKTLLQIVNNVSQDIIGEDASDDGQRPSKTKLIRMANDVQRDVVERHDDWLFMNALEAVDGFTLAAATSAKNNFAAVNLGATGVGNATSGTAYIAAALTLTAPFKPTAAVIPVGKIVVGFGEYYGNMKVTICPDLNGVPDTANPAATSDILNPYRPQDAALINEPFTFTNADSIDKGSYWVVLNILPNTYNGVPIVPGTVTASTGGLYKDTTATAWTAGENMSYTLTGYDGTYITTELTLDNTWEAVRSLKTGDGYILLPAVDPHNGTTPPSGYFWIKSFNTDGTVTLTINSPVTEIFEIIVDGIKRVLDMVADGDYPQIPRDHRDIIETGMKLALISEGLNISANFDAVKLQKDFDKQLESLEWKYRDAREDISLPVWFTVSDSIDNSANSMPLYKKHNRI